MNIYARSRKHNGTRIFFQNYTRIIFSISIYMHEWKEGTTVPGEDELKGNKTINIHGTQVDLSDK